MPAKRTSVYLTEATLAIAGEGESLSGRLNQIVSRYDGLIRRAMPELSRGEWCAIFDANNGVFPAFENANEQSFAMVWANVADAGLDEKWKIKTPKLVDKLRQLEPAQKIAVIEAIQSFWEHNEKSDDAAFKIAVKRER